MHIRLLPLLVIALCCLGSPVLAKRRLKAYGSANKFAQNCAHRLDALYTDHYTGAIFNEVPGPEGQRVVCNGQCQLDCQSVIKYALRVRSVSLCPAKERLVDCLNVAYDAWVDFTKVCPLFSTQLASHIDAFDSVPFNDTLVGSIPVPAKGTVQAAAAAALKRAGPVRLPYGTSANAEGEAAVVAKAPAPAPSSTSARRRALLAQAEGEAAAAVVSTSGGCFPDFEKDEDIDLWLTTEYETPSPPANSARRGLLSVASLAGTVFGVCSLLALL